MEKQKYKPIDIKKKPINCLIVNGSSKYNIENKTNIIRLIISCNPFNWNAFSCACPNLLAGTWKKYSGFC